jgi:hypothetical protein
MGVQEKKYYEIVQSEFLLTVETVFIVYVYDLLNGALSRIISEYCIRRDVEGSDGGLI